MGGHAGCEHPRDRDDEGVGLEVRLQNIEASIGEIIYDLDMLEQTAHGKYAWAVRAVCRQKKESLRKWFSEFETDVR